MQRVPFDFKSQSDIIKNINSAKLTSHLLPSLCRTNLLDSLKKRVDAYGTEDAAEILEALKKKASIMIDPERLEKVPPKSKHAWKSLLETANNIDIDSLNEQHTGHWR